MKRATLNTEAAKRVLAAMQDAKEAGVLTEASKSYKWPSAQELLAAYEGSDNGKAAAAKIRKAAADAAEVKAEDRARARRIAAHENKQRKEYAERIAHSYVEVGDTVEQVVTPRFHDSKTQEPVVRVGKVTRVTKTQATVEFVRHDGTAFSVRLRRAMKSAFDDTGRLDDNGKVRLQTVDNPLSFIGSNRERFYAAKPSDEVIAERVALEVVRELADALVR